jgi:DNA-binding GntR family transcriptional regulator
MAIDYRGKRDVIAQLLRAEIVHGALPVGTRLRQDEIARRYGVSPTPVREALRVLETQGFVTYEAHRGVTVANFAGSFEQVYRLREALEGLATEMAVVNMTPERASALTGMVDRIEEADRIDGAAAHRAHLEFHELLYAGCDFPALLDLIQIVWSRFPWEELLSLPAARSLRADHRPIAARAAEGDAAGAAEALRTHFRSVREVIGRTLEQRADQTGAASDGT